MLIVAPSLVLAQWTAFLPTPYENGAFLDAYTSFERDNLHSGQLSTRWTDAFFKETLTLYSIGYSYHPRFVQYRFSVAGAFRQENYDNASFSSAGWREGTGLEYDLNLYVLPEHPYNLQLFARQYEPLFKEQAATQHNLTQTSRGANFRYRDKPYFVHAGYIDDAVESAESSSDVMRVYVDGEYFKRYVSGNELSFTGAFTPSWFTASQGLEGSTLQYSAGNFVNLQRARLSSSFSQDSYEQKSPSSGKLTSDNLSWHEFLTVYLPWNVRTDLTYRYQNNDGTLDDSIGGQHRKLSNTSDDIQLNVIHKLYESLDSTYTFLHNSQDSFGGNSTFQSHGGTLNYTKTIPHGRILAGINLANGDTTSEGQTDVVNDPFPGIPVPGFFTLRQQNVDPRSIEVFLRSPLPPFELIRLVEDVDYIVVPTLNTFEIRVFTLPPEFVVPGTYDFVVSYSLATGTFELQTDSYGGNVSVELFDRLVTPYFAYAVVQSNVLSGVFPGVPLDSTTYTAGLLLQRGPLLARGEYQDVQWNISPYRSWLAELQYSANITPTINMFAATSYLNRYYPHGEFQSQPEAFTEETISASGSIQKELFSRNLFLLGGGSYSRIQGLIDSNSYSVNTSLTWRIGKVELSAGATAYATDSSGASNVSTKRDHELFFLKFRRRLF
jgi:hypothetical protein